MWKRLYAASREIFSRRPLLFAAVSALAAVFLAWGYLDRREAQILAIAEPAAVVVAKRDIAPGEAIDPTNARLQTVPRRFLDPAAIGSLDEAAGRVAAVALRAGSQLTFATTRRPGEMRTLAALVPTAKRAAAISLDEGQARLIRPDDVVDVLATLDLGGEASVRRTTATIVAGAQVLAVNAELAGAVELPRRRENAGGIFSGDAMALPASRGMSVVTLAVTPEEAQVLAFSENSGRLALALRAWGDDVEAARPTPTTIGAITGGHEEIFPMKRGYREYRGR